MSELEILKYQMMSKELSTNIKLTPTQDFAYKLMAKGESVFLTGPAGVGKSAIIKLFTKVYSSSKIIALCSTTGTSALLIGGVTLHSYTGIGLGKGSVEQITELIFTDLI